jgi:hypothetical protein
MKKTLISSTMVTLMALVFLMGTEVVPAWGIFDFWSIRLAIFGVAFTLLCYQTGVWPKGNEKQSGTST